MAFFRCIGDSESSFRSVTFTLIGARGDIVTVTNSDEEIISTVLFDAEETSREVTLTIVREGEILVFTSSVSKSITDLTSDYSKSVLVDAETTEVKLIPDGALFWYGNTCDSVNGGYYNRGPVYWNASLVYTGTSHSSEITEYLTDYIYRQGTQNSDTISGFCTNSKVSLTGYNNIRAVGTYSPQGNKEYYPYIKICSSVGQYRSQDVNLSGEFQSTSSSNTVNITGNISSISEPGYINICNGITGVRGNYGGTMNISAVWLE